MRVYNILLLCCISSIFIAVSGNDGAFNIHGGYFDVHSFNSGAIGGKTKTIYKWGESSATGSNRKEIAGPESYCWANAAEAYCYVKLIVSTNNVPNEEHYQIKGAKIIIYDVQSIYVASTTESFGLQEAYKGVEQIRIAEGQIWSPTQNDWGYGYLELLVNKTTRPSTADAFLVEKRNAGPTDLASGTQVIGQKDPKSKEHFISTFRSYSDQWWYDTLSWWKIYITQTKVIKNTVIYAEKTVTPVTSDIIGSLTLKNLGSVTSDTFAKLGSKESITLETSTSMETTFDFSIDVGSSVSLEVGFVTAAVEVNLHAGYSSTEASSSTTTKATEKTIEWPTTCPDGMKLTIDLYKHTIKQTVPIEFTFERVGVQWNERKIFEAKVNSLEQILTDCCLESDRCGTTAKMCKTIGMV